MSDFWEDMQNAYVVESAIDRHLQAKNIGDDSVTSMRDLTQKMREKNALPLPVEAGSRVRFVANLGSVLSYPDIPDTGVDGTVVTVRTAHGDTTSDESRVFVLWDDGKFRPIQAEHLRRATSNNRMARAVRIVTSDLGNLAAFFTPTMGTLHLGSGEELVHKATKDLWSFKQDGDNFVIQRLFTEDGNPLKV